MSTIDEQFIDYIVKSLVGKPEAVKIERRIDEKGVLLELTVDAADLGRVIGKRGATAQSLRTLLRALGIKNEARYNLKIIDTANGEPIGRPTRPARDDYSDKPDTDNNSIVEEPVHDTPAESKADEEVDVDDELDVEEKDDLDSGDVLSRTRKELEDLDDLDV
ncbi:MAG TPA: KH domain-containing protein [Candidatus Saccharimonadales bacterium]|nr:KH domain-containing protein [Candidatus Saccharimonadales bacterium]